MKRCVPRFYALTVLVGILSFGWIDPDGLRSASSSRDSGEHGSMIDPDGLCLASSNDQGDHGTGIDPNGLRLASSNDQGDHGSMIDPNGLLPASKHPIPTTV